MYLRKKLTLILVTICAVLTGFYSLSYASDGAPYTWGDNSYGQLGNNSTTNSYNPVQADGLTGVVSVVGGYYYSAALKNDGSVWTWGYNVNGQLGDGTTTDSYTPVQVKDSAGTGFLTGVVSISSRFLHSAALTNDGAVWAWGYNGEGQLGNNSTTDSSTPVQVSGLTGVVSISAGGYHTLALMNDGSVWAWGENSEGQLGDGTGGVGVISSIPVQVKDSTGTGYLTGVVSISAGSFYSMALKSDGTVWAWGWNDDGQLGDGDGTYTSKYLPVQVKDSAGTGYLTGAVSIAAGDYHSMALKDDGTVWTWGDNSDGQLGDGDGTYTSKYLPVQVKDSTGTGNFTGAVSVSAGTFHSIALKVDGTVWAWGDNFYGQLGDGSTTDSLTPIEVSGLDGAISISAGFAHTIASADMVSPVISLTSPVSGSTISSPAVGYILSESAKSGQIKFTRTGGNADSGSPHVYSLTGSELNSGAHSVDTGFTLTEGTFYEVSFAAVDLAGNPAITVSNISIYYDTSYGAFPKGNIDNTGTSLDRVDGNDLIKLSLSFGSSQGDANWNPVCDLDTVGSSNNRIDGNDLITLGSHFGEKK